MIKTFTLLLAFSGTLWIAGCGGHEDDHHHGEQESGGKDHHEDHGDIHNNAVDLIVIDADASGISARQANGAIQAGQECILLVKLDAPSQEIKAVRAWIGGEDRTLSQVGLGHYDADESLYDIHAIAPKPLAEDAMWWIEVERSDGTKVFSTAKPLTN